MCERGDRDGLDVVGEDEVASTERCLAAGQLEQRQAPARAGAHGGALGPPRCLHEIDAVAAHALGDVHRLERALHLEQRLAVDDRTELDLVRLPLDPAPSTSSSSSRAG